MTRHNLQTTTTHLAMMMVMTLMMMMIVMMMAMMKMNTLHCICTQRNNIKKRQKQKQRTSLLSYVHMCMCTVFSYVHMCTCCMCGCMSMCMCMCSECVGACACAYVHMWMCWHTTCCILIGKGCKHWSMKLCKPWNQTLQEAWSLAWHQSCNKCQQWYGTKKTKSKLSTSQLLPLPTFACAAWCMHWSHLGLQHTHILLPDLLKPAGQQLDNIC